MENEGKECRQCLFWNGYYVKGLREYAKIPCGWCRLQQKDVRAEGSCEEYMKKYYNDSMIPRGELKVYINEVLRKIATIRKMIEEERNEQMRNVRILQASISKRVKYIKEGIINYIESAKNITLESTK